MVFHWSLSDSKSPQISRTFLSILADPCNAVVLMILACPLMSNSSSLFTKPLGTVPSPTIRIDMIITFIFYGFLVLW